MHQRYEHLLRPLPPTRNIVLHDREAAGEAVFVPNPLEDSLRRMRLRYINWKLILQIAQHAGGGWPEKARRSAIYLSRTPYEPSSGVQLLGALRAMFAKNRTQITSEQVVQELLADPNSQWHEYRSRGPITKNQVAALLKDFEIRPVVVHPTKRADLSRHGYRTAQFEDVFARFLPPEPNIRTLKRGGQVT